MPCFISRGRYTGVQDYNALFYIARAIYRSTGLQCLVLYREGDIQEYRVTMPCFISRGRYTGVQDYNALFYIARVIYRSTGLHKWVKLGTSL